ncbi:nitrogenase component 1 [Clostridium sp. WILCCON 0269]|uniref:Nitrogenase component 1 n=1 Tax=Candidatus Clostridium eludens TaxID=3381663 RepID=A0ABW8SFD3_9CLOT
MSNVIEQPRYTCAIGAQHTVLAIKGAVPVLHCGPGCSNKVAIALATSAGYQGESDFGGSHIPSTNSSEKDIVFGGEKKLDETIDGALQVLKGELFVVLTGCTADIVGDDVASIAAKYRREGKPVVNAETAGFKGTNYLGHELVIESIIEQYIGDVKPKIRKGLVNVFSVVPNQDPFWRGDLKEIKRILIAIGLEVNILFGYESKGVEEWRDIPNAEFNLVLNPWVGLKAAKLLEAKYGTKLLHYPELPVGAAATSKFLRTVSEFANLDKDRVEQVIKEEEFSFYKYFLDTGDFFAEARAELPYELYTIADSAYGIGASSFLINEVGYVPKGSFLIDNVPDKYKENIVNTFEGIDEEYKGKVFFENDGGAIENKIRKDVNVPRKTLILGSAWENKLSEDLYAPVVYISNPIFDKLIVNKTYVGYNGGLNLIEEIYSSILSDKNFNRRANAIAI